MNLVRRGRAGHWWHRNMLALRMGRTYDFLESLDMGEDLRPSVKYLKKYGRIKPGG